MATSAVPEDLAAALEGAGLTDASRDSAARRLRDPARVQTAKKAETRERRMAKYVGMLAAGETPYSRRSYAARAHRQPASDSAPRRGEEAPVG